MLLKQDHKLQYNPCYLSYFISSHIWQGKLPQVIVILDEIHLLSLSRAWKSIPTNVYINRKLSNNGFGSCFQGISPFLLDGHTSRKTWQKISILLGMEFRLCSSIIVSNFPRLQPWLLILTTLLHQLDHHIVHDGC